MKSSVWLYLHVPITHSAVLRGGERGYWVMRDFKLKALKSAFNFRERRKYEFKSVNCEWFACCDT